MAGGLPEALAGWLAMITSALLIIPLMHFVGRKMEHPRVNSILQTIVIASAVEMPFDGFKAQCREPANDMPAYSTAVLSDQEIADVYAFLQSLPGARSAKDISILNN